METLSQLDTVRNAVSFAPLTGNVANVPPADFAAAIAEMEALPETLADVTSAYDVGMADAEHGLRCDPLKHYAKLGDIEMYIFGWKDATAALHDELEATIDNLFAPMPVDDQVDYDRELEMYEDWLADQQWHACGAW